MKGKKILKTNTIITLVLLALVLILLIQNIMAVDLNFLFWEIKISKIIFILLILIIGFFIGYFYAVSKRKK